MSYRGPKAKLSRRLGIPLTAKCSAVMRNKPQPPGQHGNRRRFQQSEYSKQLIEKQRLKFQYNVTERKLRNYYTRAKRQAGNTSEALIVLLEHRLDCVIFRAGFAPTIFAARQLVSHGHVEVGGRKVDIPSFHVAVGSTVSVREKSKKMALIQDSLVTAESPVYMDSDNDTLTAVLSRPPIRDEIPIVCELQQVVEFYSR